MKSDEGAAKPYSVAAVKEIIAFYAQAGQPHASYYLAAALRVVEAERVMRVEETASAVSGLKGTNYIAARAALDAAIAKWED